MTKQEIINKLKELEIEFEESASKADLQALLPDDEEIEEGGTDDDSEAEESVGDEIEEDLDETPANIEVSETAPKGKGVHVFDKNGNYVRTYTAEMVKDTVYKTAMEPAKIICQKNAGWTLKEVK